MASLNGGCDEGYWEDIRRECVGGSQRSISPTDESETRITPAFFSNITKRDSCPFSGAGSGIMVEGDDIRRLRCALNRPTSEDKVDVGVRVIADRGLDPESGGHW